MAKNIFVGSLPYSATEEALRTLFGQYGQVQSVTIIKDRYSNQSRGFGFVEMNTEEETKQAIEKLNGYNLENRSIVVKEALPKPTYTNGRSANNRRDSGFRQRRY